MRILSLSHRLADPLIDNHHIFNAPVVADYEAIVVDIEGVAQSIQDAVAAAEQYLTYADLPVFLTMSSGGGASYTLNVDCVATP